MRVEVKQLTNIDLARAACKFTTDEESTIKYSTLCKNEHSPLRTILYWIEMYDIPTFVSVHLVRHKVGVEHFVKSNREDRSNNETVPNRNTLVNHAMLINAQSLINMAQVRLCSKSSIETNRLMMLIKNNLELSVLSKYLLPKCDYRNGICGEVNSCKWTGE